MSTLHPHPTRLINVGMNPIGQRVTPAKASGRSRRARNLGSGRNQTARITLAAKITLRLNNPPAWLLSLQPIEPADPCNPTQGDSANRRSSSGVQLFKLLMPDLRKIAGLLSRRTSGPAALVNEPFLRLDPPGIVATSPGDIRQRHTGWIRRMTGKRAVHLELVDTLGSAGWPRAVGAQACCWTTIVVICPYRGPIIKRRRDSRTWLLRNSVSCSLMAFDQFHPLASSEIAKVPQDGG